MSVEIDIDLLRQVLRYEPETGLLFWRKRPASMFNETARRSAEHSAKVWNSRMAHQEAFTAKTWFGGRHGRIFSGHFYAHRVAWAIFYGKWPEGDLDHIDGDPSNNRINNLRRVSHRQNMENKRLYRNNSTGQAGIFRKKCGCWQAHIGGSGGRRHLGTFAGKDQAIAARRSAERELGYHENHGRNQ